MPTRHLSDEQRQRYASFAADPSPDELARYFHLDRTDREVTESVMALPSLLTMDLPGFAWPDGFMRCAGVATITPVPWSSGLRRGWS